MRHLSTFVRKRQNLLTTSKGLDKIHPNQFQSSISKFKTIRLFETWTGSVKTIQIFFKCTLLGISQNYHLVPASAHAKRTELNMMDRRWHSYLASALLFWNKLITPATAATQTADQARHSRSRSSRYFFCHKEQHYVNWPRFHLGLHTIFLQGSAQDHARTLQGNSPGSPRDILTRTCQGIHQDLCKSFSQGLPDFPKFTSKKVRTSDGPAFCAEMYMDTSQDFILGGKFQGKTREKRLSALIKHRP